MNAHPQNMMDRIMAEITCDSHTHEVIRRKVKELAEYASDQVDRVHELGCDLETQKNLRKKDAAFFEGKERDLRAEIMRINKELGNLSLRVAEKNQTIEKLQRKTRNCYEPGSDLTEALAQRREAIQELEKENRNLKRELRDAEDLLGAKVEGKTTELRKEVLAAHKRIAALANQLKECWKCRERQGVYIDRLRNKHPDILLQSDFEKEQRLEILRGRLARIRDIAEGNGCE